MLFVGAVFLGVQLLMNYWGKENKPPPEGGAGGGGVAQTFTIPTEIAGQEDLIRLGDSSANSKDKLAVFVNRQGASIERVELNVNDFTNEVVRRGEEPRPLILFQAAPGFVKPYATQKIHVWMNGEDKSIPAEAVGKYLWKNVSDLANPYEARLQIVNSDAQNKGIVKIVKVFRIDPKSYDLTISHEVTNLTDVPLKVWIDQMASMDFPQDRRMSDDRFYHAAGIETVRRTIIPDRFHQAHHQLSPTSAPASRELGNFQGTDPLVWVASGGRFFAAITRPMQETGNKVMTLAVDNTTVITLVDHVAKTELVRMHQGADTRDTLLAIQMSGNERELAAKSETTLQLAVYFGPRRGDELRGNSKAEPGSPPWAHHYYKSETLLKFHGGCTWCTFDWIGVALLWMLRQLATYATFGNYGVAIILLVIIIRAILHPLTKMSQVNMAMMGKKMRDIQPLIEANKKKYAKDKKKQSEEMMRIYRENNVNPAGGVMGCLPMLLQMPIWIAMWATMQTDIDLFHASFIPGWINDLSAPDRTIEFTPFKIPLIGTEISALNVLPLLLAVVFFVQMKVQMASTPKPADEQQAQMQKMTQYMVLIFPIFLYNFPSGLNLYYFGSTLAGLVDTYFVRKTLKRKGILPTNAPALPTKEE